MNPDRYWPSRISPRPEIGYRELAALGNLDPYGQHRLLWKFFDLPQVENPAQTAFLFRFEIRDGRPLFYVPSGVPAKPPRGLSGRIQGLPVCSVGGQPVSVQPAR